MANTKTTASDFVGFKLQNDAEEESNAEPTQDTTAKQSEPASENHTINVQPFKPFGMSQNRGQHNESFSPSRPAFDGSGVTQPAQMALQGPTEEVTGILDVQMEGHGFLRPKFVPSNKDIYISQSQIRRFMLRAGDK